MRRALTPPSHRKVAQRLGGETFPILVLDGQAIGDSTRIIAELEDRHPEPPLYPSDPLERRRALELEEFFDEELGPYTRKLLVHHLLPDREVFLATFTPDLPARRRLLARALFVRLRRRAREAFGLDESGVAHAFDKLRAAGERFSDELGPSGYLVGDRFTIADLTAATLVAPVVAPEEFPYAQPQRGHPLFARLREALSAHGLADWSREMYARHRGDSAEITRSPGAAGASAGRTSAPPHGVA